MIFRMLSASRSLCSLCSLCGLCHLRCRQPPPIAHPLEHAYGIQMNGQPIVSRRHAFRCARGRWMSRGGRVRGPDPSPQKFRKFRKFAATSASPRSPPSPVSCHAPRQESGAERRVPLGGRGRGRRREGTVITQIPYQPPPLRPDLARGNEKPLSRRSGRGVGVRAARYRSSNVICTSTETVVEPGSTGAAAASIAIPPPRAIP